MLFAGRSLLHEPTRLAISIAGIGFSIMLVIVLVGVRQQTVDYLSHSPGSVVVVSAATQGVWRP